MTAELVFEASVRLGETRNIEVVATEAAAYDALVVETHQGFDVCGFTIDGKKQMANPMPIPAAAFNGCVRLSTDPICRGTRVVLKVRSACALQREFRAKLLVIPAA